MSNLLKPNHVSEKLSFRYDLQVFKDCVKPFFALLSQVLGLDNDKQVQEVMVSVVYSLTQFESTNQDINFDEFLTESIHSQLMNFHTKRNFRYQTLLLQIIVQQNWNELQKMGVYLFIDTLNLSEELGGKPFVHFANKIMSMIYTLIFDQELPKVTEMMRSHLQTSSKVT